MPEFHAASQDGMVGTLNGRQVKEFTYFRLSPGAAYESPWIYTTYCAGVCPRREKGQGGLKYGRKSSMFDCSQIYPPHPQLLSPACPAAPQVLPLSVHGLSLPLTYQCSRLQADQHCLPFLAVAHSCVTFLDTVGGALLLEC